MPYSDPEAAKAARARYRARQRAQRPATVRRADKLRQRKSRDRVTLTLEITLDLKRAHPAFVLVEGLREFAPWAAGHDDRQAAIVRALEVRPRVKSKGGLFQWLKTTAFHILIGGPKDLHLNENPIWLHGSENGQSGDNAAITGVTLTSGDDRRIYAALRETPGELIRIDGLTIRYGVRLPD